jgi:ABC-type Fe3+ transport system permease subunit
MIGRLIGWAIFLVGLLVLARDVLVSIDTRHWAPITLGQLWYDLNPVSISRFQQLVMKRPFLWNSIIVTILLCWAFAALMVLGIVILAISSRRRRA